MSAGWPSRGSALPLHLVAPSRLPRTGQRLPAALLLMLVLASLGIGILLGRLTTFSSQAIDALGPSLRWGSPRSPAAVVHVSAFRNIHQTWKSRTVPKEYAASVQTWIDMNPGYTHRLWDDEEVAELIESHYPDVWEVWDRLRPVERSDAFRYAVVHKHGGVYADLDTDCLEPIDTWGASGYTAVVGYEGILDNEAERKEFKFAQMEQFCQWVFGFAAGHPLLAKALQLVADNTRAGVKETLQKTGPGAFTNAVRWYGFREDVLWLPGPAFATGGFRCCDYHREQKALVKHNFAGTWKSWWGKGDNSNNGAILEAMLQSLRNKTVHRPHAVMNVADFVESLHDLAPKRNRANNSSSRHY